MGDDQFTVMSKLGFEKFHGVGHDRGARVLHRMVMDRSGTAAVLYDDGYFADL